MSWRVAPGDTVAINDVLVEIETAKSLVELPVAVRGRRRRAARRRGRRPSRSARRSSRSPARCRGAAGHGGQSEHGEPHEPEARAAVRCSSATAAAGTCSRAGASPAERPVRRRSASSPSRRSASSPAISASTSPRVTPSGADGEVTRDDVMKHASQASVFRNIETPEWGAVREETIPAPSEPRPVGLARGVARAAGIRPTVATSRSRSRACARPRASAMVQSAYTAPHVTVWNEVDAIAHDGARQAAEGLAGLRRHQGLAAADHGARRDLGRAPHPDGERGVGRDRRRRARSACATT